MPPVYNEQAVHHPKDPSFHAGHAPEEAPD